VRITVHLLLTEPAEEPGRRRSRRGTDVRSQTTEEVIRYLREQHPRFVEIMQPR
jgi:hypothetical protein